MLMTPQDIKGRISCFRVLAKNKPALSLPKWWSGSWRDNEASFPASSLLQIHGNRGERRGSFGEGCWCAEHRPPHALCTPAARWGGFGGSLWEAPPILWNSGRMRSINSHREIAKRETVLGGGVMDWIVSPDLYDEALAYHVSVWETWPVRRQLKVS